MTLSISKLDLSLQTRVRINPETVEDYQEHMADGKVFPPVTVYDTDGVLSLVDGFHRVAALSRLGKEEVEANVIKGTRKEALKAALKANDKHGLRRTNADKQNCLKMAWENRDILFTEFRGEDDAGNKTGLPSCRQLADVTGITFKTVANFFTETGVCKLHTPQATQDTEEGLGKWSAAAVENRATTDVTTVTKDHLEERHADVRANLKKGLDRYGVTIPEKIKSAFLSKEPRLALRDIKAMRDFLEKRIFGGDLAFVALGQPVLSKFDAIIADFKFWSAWCVCRGCHGTGCPMCGYRGFQTKSQYERNPREYKVDQDR